MVPTLRIFMKFHISRKSVEKIVQVSLKSNKNNGYFTRRPTYIYNHISLSSSYNGRCTENQNTHFVFNNWSQTRAFCEIMWKNTVIPRLTKIIRSGITFVSRNVISHQPSGQLISLSHTYRRKR